MNMREVSAAEGTAPRMPWWYTLAHAGTPARGLALPGVALDQLITCLERHGMPVPAPLRDHERLRRRSALSPEGLRYLWAFRRMRDALQVARANHRSDYHAYSLPNTLREDSLNRLYRRFPLDEYPKTTIMLISGAFVCDDPLLGPDPAPHSLAAVAPTAIAPSDWARYTLCGFELGASLLSVLPTDRWLRVTPPALEDAWAAATYQLQAQGTIPTSQAVERVTLDLLLRGLPDEAFAYVSGSARRRRQLADARDAAAETPEEPERDEAPAMPKTLIGDAPYARYQRRTSFGRDV